MPISNGCLPSGCAHRRAVCRKHRITFFAVCHRHFFSALPARAASLSSSATSTPSNTFLARMSLASRRLPYYHLVFFMSWDPVYRLVKQIPRGRVITYGSLAKAVRLRGGARTAGRAMAATPSGRGIPWHRVVGYGGKLLIREPYSSLQRKLLESEGVRLLKSRVDLKLHLWQPRNLRMGQVKRTASRKRTSRGAKSKR